MLYLFYHMNRAIGHVVLKSCCVTFVAKCARKLCQHVDSILDSIFIVFWSILATKNHPKIDQKPIKNRKGNCINFLMVFVWFLYDFWRIFGVIDLCFLDIFGRSKSPKTSLAPGPRPRASGIDFGTILVASGIDFGPILVELSLIFLKVLKQDGPLAAPNFPIVTIVGVVSFLKLETWYIL